MFGRPDERMPERLADERVVLVGHDDQEVGSIRHHRLSSGKIEAGSGAFLERSNDSERRCRMRGLLQSRRGPVITRGPTGQKTGGA